MSGKRHFRRESGMFRAPISRNVLFPESIVKMSDRFNLRRIIDLTVPAVLLATAAVGVIHAISIGATLRDLRALEPITQPDLEAWRCLSVAGSSQGGDGEPRLGTDAVQLPPVERSAGCPTRGGQVRPQ
jgi:hypothetical protein